MSKNPIAKSHEPLLYPVLTKSPKARTVKLNSYARHSMEEEVKRLNELASKPPFCYIFKRSNQYPLL